MTRFGGLDRWGQKMSDISIGQQSVTLSQTFELGAGRSSYFVSHHGAVYQKLSDSHKAHYKRSEHR